MIQAIFSIFFLSCLMVLTPLYAASDTLTTYYPAPQGNYNNIAVSGALTLKQSQNYTCPNLPDPNTELINFNGYLAFCNSNGNGNAQSPQPAFLWSSGFTYIYPSNAGFGGHASGYDVAIGGWAADPGVPFAVKGDTIITGNTTFGTLLTSSSAPSAANTTTINGNTTLNGTVSVPATGSVTSSGPVTLNGTTNLNGTIYIKGYSNLQFCDNTGSNCQPLEVSTGSDGKNYAVYGP